VLASFILSGAFQPGQQDAFDQGASQEVVVVRLRETQVLRLAAKTSHVLQSAFNTTCKHSGDKCLNIFLPILFRCTGIIVPWMWCIFQWYTKQPTSRPIFKNKGFQFTNQPQTFENVTPGWTKLLGLSPEKQLGCLGPTSTEAVNLCEDSEKEKQSKNSLVLGGGLENEAVAVVFIVCTLIRESKNNNACNADFGPFPCSFSQARQPWEPLIVWHTRGTASITKHRAGQPFLRIKYVRDDKNLPSMGSGNNKKKYTRG